MLNFQYIVSQLIDQRFGISDGMGCLIPQDPPSSNPKIPRQTDGRTDGRWRTNKQPNNTPNIDPLHIFNQGENL